ncbi:Serine--tRNA ligase, mitochondrial [Sporothrix eucalyptigena]|uniref:serine--tRNA ligase n=1 Tax=Sporothrix eucalyptigena TaxID=1812306 RepID=A0ABP0AX33_9PEZI
MAAHLYLRAYSSAPSSEAAADSTQQAQAPSSATASSQGPQPNIDIKHIRQNVELHEENCVRRNYRAMAEYPSRISEIHKQLQTQMKENRSLRESANRARKTMAAAKESSEENDADREEFLEEARNIKQRLAAAKASEAALHEEIQRLAIALPNLTSDETPDGEEVAVLSYINCDGVIPEGSQDAGKPFNESDPSSSTSIVLRTTPEKWRSHVDIGTDLGLLDFPAAAAASGWGWYYLLGDGARLEQALIQYALAVAHRHGWQVVSPPSIVRSGIAAACGFQPRDQGGEQQTYAIEGMPLSLTATAEIPLAALYADATIDVSPEKPIRRAAVSRCYRAEAGSRGASTKGLYRVHEFTKVEMFAWTSPDLDDATDVYDELVDVQTEILSSLGLPCRVLEMPATDLGASAYRKIDIEAFFPSRCRTLKDGNKSDAYDYSTGWGEVTSASICTDYQTRRLATRTRTGTGASIQSAFPWTLNGTALAVPRIIAAILENGWDEATKTVAIPECLWPWMDGQEKLGKIE